MFNVIIYYHQYILENKRRTYIKLFFGLVIIINKDNKLFFNEQVVSNCANNEIKNHWHLYPKKKVAKAEEEMDPDQTKTQGTTIVVVSRGRERERVLSFYIGQNVKRKKKKENSTQTHNTKQKCFQTN